MLRLFLDTSVPYIVYKASRILHTALRKLVRSSGKRSRKKIYQLDRAWSQKICRSQEGQLWSLISLDEARPIGLHEIYGENKHTKIYTLSLSARLDKMHLIVHEN